MPGLAKLVFLGNDFQLLAIRKTNIVPLPIASLAGFPQLVIKLLITLAVKRCHDKLSHCAPRVGVQLVRSAVLQDLISGLPCRHPDQHSSCGLAQVVPIHCLESAQQSRGFGDVLLSLC